MKNLLSILFLCSGLAGYAQYTPNKFPITSKSIAPAQAVPLDARSWYYDAATFTMRAYTSTTEVLSYLPVNRRGGNFPIYVKTGGVTTEYWFKNCTNDTCLVVKASGSGSGEIIVPGFGINKAGSTVKIDSTEVPTFFDLADSMRAVSLRTNLTTNVFDKIDTSKATGLSLKYLRITDSTPVLIGGLVKKYGGVIRIAGDTTGTNPFPGRASFPGYFPDGSQGFQTVKEYSVSRTYSELVAKATGAVTGMIYPYAPGDGTIRHYYFDSTDVTSQHNGVYVIVSGTKRLKMFHEFVDPWDFGARPNDGLSDSAACRRASDFAIYNLKTPAIRFTHGGTYDVHNWIIKKDENADGQFEFVTISIEGTAAPIGTGLTATVTLKAMDPKGFIVDIEKGRTCAIRNLSFEGHRTNAPSNKNLIEGGASVWTNNGIYANGRYAMYAGLIIDGGHANVPTGQRFINAPEIYTDNGYQGTSGIEISGCHFRDLIVGIMISPNGTTQNCDNISAVSCTQLNNRSFWASGQTQSRGNIIFDLYSVGSSEFLVNCKEYGYQLGTPPNILNSNIAGGHKYMFWFDGGFSGMNITNTYIENLWAWGKAGTLPVDIVNTTANMMQPVEYNVFTAPVLFEGTQINFVGGTLQWFDNTFAHGFPFNGSVNFTGTTIVGGTPFGTATYQKDVVTFNNVRLRNLRGEGYVWQANTLADKPLSLVNNRPIIPGTKITSEFSKVTYESVGDKIENTLYEASRIFRLVASNNTAYFISTNANRYRYGDFFSTYNQIVDYGNDIFTGTNAPLGWVYAVSGDTVKLNYVPYGVTEGGSYDLYMTRIPNFVTRTFGDLTAGSNVISNGKFQDGITFMVGAKIKGAGIATGATVDAVTSTTITMSLPATTTLANVEMYDAKITAKATNIGIDANDNSVLVYDHFWFTGDRVENIRGGTEAFRYVTTGGIHTTATPAIWTIVGGSGGGGAPANMMKTDATNTMTASSSILFPGSLTNPSIQVGSMYFQDGSILENLVYQNDAFRYQANGGGVRIRPFGDAVYFQTASTGVAGDAATLATRFIVNANGVNMPPLAGAGTVPANLNAAGDLVRGTAGAQNDSYFTVNMTHAPFNPADATIYYFSNYLTNSAPNIVSNRRQSAVPMNCTLVGWSITAYHENNTSVSSESTLVSLVINGTVSGSVVALNSGVGFNEAAFTPMHYTAMNGTTSVTAGSTIEARVFTPTWTTNPINVVYSIILFFKPVFL